MEISSNLTLTNYAIEHGKNIYSIYCGKDHFGPTASV